MMRDGRNREILLGDEVVFVDCGVLSFGRVQAFEEEGVVVLADQDEVLLDPADVCIYGF